MNKVLVALAAGAFVCISLPSVSADDMECPHGMMQMKNMDTDNDGTISKEEFMKSHEAIWDKMKKNKDGLVDLKDMQMMHKRGMKDKEQK